jgi:hypothetical protein
LLPGNYLQVKLADHPEPANIIRWATKIFPLIVEAHSTAAEPELDLGGGRARASGSGIVPAALDLQAAPHSSCHYLGQNCKKLAQERTWIAVLYTLLSCLHV